MKTIGLIGGLSWESSAEYYRIINECMRDRLGGSHNAQSLMLTVDFGLIQQMQQEDRWEEANGIMIDAARRLERGGADFFLICANTMHRNADIIQAAVSIPLIHIAEATGQRIAAQGFHRVGLLGTKYTMEGTFYTGLLTDRFGFEVLLPDEAERADIHRIIYDELCLGIINPASRVRYATIMHSLELRGAQAIILGCTEIMLLVKPEDSHVPQFDTTRIHAETAVDLALR